MGTDSSTPAQPSTRSPLIAGLLSLLVPGAGQLYARQGYRAIVVFIGACITVLATLWYAVPAWYIVPIALWLWNVLDAVSSARGRKLGALVPVVIVLVMGYGIGWQVTEIHPAALANNINRVRIILAPMLRPDFLAQVEITNTAWAPVEVPCGPNPPPATNTVDGIEVKVAPDCGKIGDQLAVEGSGLWPNTQTRIYWSTPIGERLPLGEGFSTPLYVDSDSQGNMQAQIKVPPTALSSAPDPTKPLEHRVYLVQARPQAELMLSENGNYVVQGIEETLFLALMSTTLGALGAIPISFLAARNLMSANPVTFAIYVATRTVLNVVRSIEPLIIAIVFVVIVGLGPFAGVIAITLHTVAALGKLYSEVVEGIDPGPLEAIRAVGGNWVQMVRYGVIPQIVPPFASFTLFRWDINVRTSTIIGFVGGGGIGFFLYQWIIKADFRAVSSSFIAIAIIVIVLDFVSARIRARLV
jgi:phosphonate transport system permease protein